MLKNSRFPGSTSSGDTQLDWNRAPFELCDEECMLMALSISICVQILLMAYIALTLFNPFAWRISMYNAWQRQRFSNFIFGRLLLHLDTAQAVHLVGQQAHGCQRARRMAMDAVQLFRRDAMKILYPAHDIRSVHAADLYFVLDEEERLIADAGYDLVNIEVTPDFLIHLLYPERARHFCLSETS
ncbi:uncharacterized protein LOC111071909 [Drosophila obscura]|uniref:uncharacterized protein LOC111071909 n=1 Tax=Drosophila obscura TaxID=7282 RepID=UPI001BB231A6|nr:uncharacterized protein LOC111071909 [Drosophila obscura]